MIEYRFSNLSLKSKVNKPLFTESSILFMNLSNERLESQGVMRASSHFDRLKENWLLQFEVRWHHRHYLFQEQVFSTLVIREVGKANRIIQLDYL